MVAPCKPMDDLVAAKESHFAAQRKRGQAKLQAPSLDLVEKHFDSITTVSTRRSARNRWARYAGFCQDNSIPLFPVVGTIVALSVHVLANGNPDTGKAYDSHTSVINAARKASAYLWEGEPGCETVGMNITSNAGIKEFCARARKAALNAKIGGGPVEVSMVPKETTKRGGKKRKVVEEESGSEASPPKGASAKKIKVDATSTTTAAVVEGSGKRAAAAPAKRGVGRPRKVLLDSPAPLTPKRPQRKKVVPPPPPSSSSSSSDSDSDSFDSPPPPPPKRSQRKKSIPVPSPAKSSPAKPSPATALSKKNLAKHERRTTKITQSKKKEDDLSTLTSLESEEVAMEVDEEEEGPVGVGVFGKIVRWFGYGAK